MLEIEDIKVADPNTEYDEDGWYIGSAKDVPKEKEDHKYGDYISLVQQVNAAVYEIKTISKELHEINKSLKLIAGRMR